MNTLREQKILVSFCGSYCHQCDWFTGKIRKTAHDALKMMETYNGFPKLLSPRINPEDVINALRIISSSGVCSGCKLQIAENVEQDRCEIRKCCYAKGFDTCAECPEFPCDVLKNHPGVKKFGCMENLYFIRDKGIDEWLEKQWNISQKE